MEAGRLRRGERGLRHYDEPGLAGLAEIEAAAHTVYQQFPPTPQYRWGLLGERLRHFGERYLRIRLSDELVAIHRMAEHEGSRTEVGRLLFNNGVRRGWGLVADFLRQAMDSGALPACDPWVAAWHLKALLEAELREPRVLGVLSALPEDAELGAVVERALAVWARGYEVQMAAPLPAGPGPCADDQATPPQPAASVSR